MPDPPSKNCHKCLKFYTYYDSNEEIVIPNKKTFIKKLEKFKEDGVENLQIIKDFDKTLSKQLYNKRRCYSSFDVLWKNSFVSKEFTVKNISLKEEYYPYEKNPLMPDYFKRHLTEIWWKNNFELTVNEEIYEWQLQEMVCQSQIKMRHGIIVLLETC